MSAAVVPEVLLAFAFILVPGTGLSVASGLGRSFVTWLAFAFAFGFAAIGLSCFLLTLVGQLGSVSLLCSWLLVSGVGWAIAIRRGHVGRSASDWREEATTEPWSSAGALLVVVGIGVARWTVAPVANVAPTALRYWADAVEIADAGRIPSETLQWSTLLEPVTNKVILNAFNAGASLLLGRDPIEPLGALLFVVTIGLVITAMAVFREMGIKRLAPLGAMLLFANQVTGSELTVDLGWNLAENWGRLVGLGGVLAAILALRPASSDQDGKGAERTAGSVRSPTIAAGVLLGATAGTHLVAASFATATVLSFAVASLVAWGRFRPFVTRGAVVLALAAVVGAAILAIPSGDLALEGAAGGERYRELRSDLGLPAGFDPTRFIVSHSVEAANEYDGLDVADVAKAFAFRGIGRAPGAEVDKELPLGLLIGPTAIAIVLTIATAAFGPTDLKATVLSAALLGLVLLSVGVAFALRYDLFALEAFGTRRLFNYALIPYVMILVGSLEWGVRSLGSGTGGRRVEVIAGVAVVSLGGLILLPAATWANADRQPALEEQLQLIRWIGDHVPCEGRILTDRRTLGTFESIAGRAAVLEGMGPHIRPAVLSRAIEEIFRARDYFSDPRNGSRFLEERGVAAVLASTPPSRFGGYAAVPRVRIGSLEGDASLRLAFRNRSGTVYLVEDFRPDPSLPRVAGRPGFSC